MSVSGNGCSANNVLITKCLANSGNSLGKLRAIGGFTYLYGNTWKVNFAGIVVASCLEEASKFLVNVYRR